MPDSVRWYLTLLVVTVAFAPLARLLASRLPGRGAFVAKPVGLLAAVWPAWLLASITPIPYKSLVVLVIVLAGALIGWGALLRRRAVDRAWLTELAAAEAIALVAFVAYIGLRGFTPQINSTEKPMDVALLSASARAIEMPPPDPWMAGESINYYYLGYLLHGTLSRLADVPTWVGYNLALATTFAMTATASAGIGYGLVRARSGMRPALAAGALALTLVVLAGNLHAPAELMRDPSGVWDAFWWQGIGWESSRVVIDAGSPFEETINEFPSFSFILGDLHPHVMALPFTLVALTLALDLLARGRTRAETNPAVRFGPLVAAGVVIGSLYPLNSWDFPTYLAGALLALAFAAGLNRATVIDAAVLTVAAVFAWAPFWATFVPFAGGSDAESGFFGRLTSTLASYRGDRTSAGELLTVFGIPWTAAVLLLAVELGRRGRGGELRFPRETWVIVAFMSVLALLIPAPAVAVTGLPCAAAIWLLAGPARDDRELTIICALFAAGFGLIVFTEFFYIQDVFNGRMNTLFKVYYQVWTLFGIGAALALLRLWRLAAPRIETRAALAGGIAMALAAGLVYPVVSAKGWTEWQGPRDWQGLDGTGQIARLAPADLAAIRWLAENARDGDVVLEAPGCSYQVNGGVPTSRFAAFTGVPTVIGWMGHERQWRAGQADLLASVEPRRADVEAMFASPEDAALLDRYGVTLLVVGSFEREGDGPQCEIAGPFPAVQEPGYPGPSWTLVFESGDTRIYRRNA